MPQENDFIEQYFSSRKNYEVKVNYAIMGTDKHYDDSQSQSYQRLVKHGKFTDEQLWKNFRLLIALNCHENDDQSFPIVGLQHSYSFEKIGNQTKVKQVMEYTVKFGLLGKLLDATMIRKQSDTGIKKFFAGPKSYAETN